MKESRIVSAELSKNVQQAARILEKGGVVAFPTETVYGLGADAFNPNAVARIFEIKKRPSFDPLIVHVETPEEAVRLWTRVPPAAHALIKNFWPGPLTLVLPKSEKVPDIVTSGLANVAVRMPDNAVALDLIRQAGCPVAAPSANLFGHTSPTTALAVWEDLGDAVDLILDGGPARVGVESTVIKIENERAILLRPGGIPREIIEKFIKTVKAPSGAAVYESPGQTQSHYAPWTPFVLAAAGERCLDSIKRHQAFVKKKRLGWPRIGFLAFKTKPPLDFFQAAEVLSANADLCEAASNLFQMMRKLDRMELDLILAERVPEKGIGAAIMDRLTKAAAGRENIGDFLNRSLQNPNEDNAEFDVT
jgi:L-threonylcarbamoyladenylate synthase